MEIYLINLHNYNLLYPDAVSASGLFLLYKLTLVKTCLVVKRKGEELMSNISNRIVLRDTIDILKASLYSANLKNIIRVKDKAWEKIHRIEYDTLIDEEKKGLKFLATVIYYYDFFIRTEQTKMKRDGDLILLRLKRFANRLLSLMHTEHFDFTYSFSFNVTDEKEVGIYRLLIELLDEMVIYINNYYSFDDKISIINDLTEVICPEFWRDVARLYLLREREDV